MTKIFEALENARQEHEKQEAQEQKQTTDLAITQDDRSQRPAKTLTKERAHILDEKLLALAQRLSVLVGKAQGMMVEFTAVQSDSGSTIMAFELARLVAECFGKEILFVLGDNDLRLPGDGNWDTQKTWQHVVQGKASVDDAVCRYETGSNLYISRIAASDVAVPGVVACPEMSGLSTRLRERFGLIIIDAPPIGASTNAAVLAPITDGAIVVLEAGKTRWQIARAALDQIVAHHGKVLGVVLNKQRHPVPDFIYSRL